MRVLGAGTRVDVAWPVAAEGVEVAADAAIALTPGGGRVGSLLDGALDGQLSEAAAAGTSRLVDVELSPGRRAGRRAAARRRACAAW